MICPVCSDHGKIAGSLPGRPVNAKLLRLPCPKKCPASEPHWKEYHGEEIKR